MWKNWKFLNDKFKGYGLEDPTGKQYWFATSILEPWLANIKQGIETANAVPSQETCPTCGSNERDLPEIGNMTSLGWVNDSERGGEVCPDDFHKENQNEPNSSAGATT